jgi:hypothetical protein
VLKDGKVLQGTFKGGTESALKFEVNGTIQEIAIGVAQNQNSRGRYEKLLYGYFEFWILCLGF